MRLKKHFKNIFLDVPEHMIECGFTKENPGYVSRDAREHDILTRYAVSMGFNNDMKVTRRIPYRIWLEKMFEDSAPISITIYSKPNAT